MSFADMPDLGPLLLAGAEDYGRNCLSLSAAALQTTRHHLDIAYGNDFYQKLDLFLPVLNPRFPVPIIVFFHGGAWRHGFKEWHGFMAPPFLKLPAIFISANYRLAPAAKIPDQFEDCCSVIDWVTQHIAGYGGDPDRIYLCGHSAGGHLATLATLHANRRRTQQIRACFPISAVFDLRPAAIASSPFMLDLVEMILGPSDDVEKYSPVAHVNDNPTPFFVMYGSNDLPFVIEQNRSLIKHMVAAGGQVYGFEAHGSSHFDTNIACADEGGKWFRTVRTWIQNDVDHSEHS